jgi:hypothetical protein
MRRPHDDEDDDGPRQTRGLMALALVLSLALAASYLIERLRQEGQIEDCLFAGRGNCDALLDRP